MTSPQRSISPSSLALQKLRVLLEALPAASEADTAAFKPIGHGQYLERLKHWLELHRDWFGESLRITVIHGSDEEGCDLVIEFEQSGVRVCFQFKSYNDFYEYRKDKDADFASKVLAQTLKAANTYHTSEVYLIFGADLNSEAHRAKLEAVKKQLAKSARVISVTVRGLDPQQALPLYEQADTLIDTNVLERILGRDIDAFLRELGHPGELWESNSVLKHIDSLYVPPSQFDEISSILRDRHLVCIAGEPHMGKTYTALYLLLTYYRNGYTPRWEMCIPDADILGELPLAERYRQSGYRDRWDIGRFVDAGQVTYIEDPFGKTSEEELRFATSDGRFDLSWLLEAVEDRGAKSDARPPKVIITSRRAAFQRAVDVQPNVRDLVVEIRQAVSYDEAKRREILQRYIEFFEPKWARDQSSGAAIIERVSEELLAPHNIYLFANRSRELENLEAVQQELEKAKEIVPALAADIALLPPLSQLVFVTTYVTSFEPSFRRFPLSRSPFWGCFENYQAYAAILGFGSKEAQDSFKSTVSNWDDVLRPVALKAIGTTSQHLAGAEFLHPSFAEATRQFIVQSDQSGVFSQICLAINRLCSDPRTRNSAAKLIHPLIANFESLPEETLDRIRFLFENGDKFIQITIVEALLANLGRLAPLLQQFLDELDPNQDEEVWYLFMQAAFPNPRLSFAQMKELWRRALAQGAIHAPRWLLALHPMDAPLLHYRQLPTELQQVIAEHLESQNQFRWYCLARPLIQHYIHVPSRLQKWVPVLASEGNEFVVYELIMALKSSYERLPSEVQSLVQDFGTDPNWKCRAYIAVWFGDQLDHLQPDHADLVRQLALQDPDGRVRISVVYAHLMFVAVRDNGDLQERGTPIFDELFYSNDPTNKAGVLFSLFDTFRYWKDSKEKEKYEKRFADLVTDQEPLVVAMLKYTIPQEDYPLELAQRPLSELLDSEIEQYEDVVSSLANGLRGVALGPGAIKQGYD